MPVCLYNVPGRTAVNLEPETVVRLAEAAPISRPSRKPAASSRRSPNWSTPASQLQDLFRRRQPRARRHRRRRARTHQRSLQRDSRRDGADDPRRAEQRMGRSARARAPLRASLRSQLLGVEPGPVKTVLNLMGRCSDTVRLPLVPPTATTRAKARTARRRTRTAEVRCARRRNANVLTPRHEGLTESLPLRRPPSRLPSSENFLEFAESPVESARGRASLG